MTAPATAATRLTPEHITSQRTAADPWISPDGTRILYVLSRPTTPDEPVQGQASEVWLVDADGGEPRRLATGHHGASHPRWSANGRRLAWLGEVAPGDPAQVFAVPAGDPDASPVALTGSATPISTFAFAPAGDRLAYLAAEDDPVAAAAASADPYVVGADHRHTRLHVVDLATGRDTIVPAGERSVVELDWNPDGTALLVAWAPSSGQDDAFARASLAIVTLDGAAPRQLTAPLGFTHTPRWSPDGRWIAWVGSVIEYDTPGSSVFVIPAEGGSPRNLTAGYEGSVVTMAFAPHEAATLVLSVAEWSTYAVRTLDVATGTMRPYLDVPRGAPGLPSLAADGATIALTVNRPTHPDEVYAGRVAPDGAVTLDRRTTHSPDLEAATYGDQSLVRWRSADGTKIEGVLVTPPGYDPARRYPLVVYVHSGPEWLIPDAWLCRYFTSFGALMAASGDCVALYPNYRGSIGRGPAFGNLSHGDLGGGDIADVLSGVDHLVAAGIADPDRVAITGYSWGGFMTAYAATAHSHRFRAAVVCAGIADWVSMSGTSSALYHQQLCHIGRTIEADITRAAAASPVAHAAGARTPTLIFHGREDALVTVNQPYELRNVLARVGAEVEAVIYPREGHAIWEPAHQLDLVGRAEAWLRRHLDLDQGGIE